MAPARPKPTAAELRLLEVLWDQGPGAVRDLLPHMPAQTGYTTVLKTLQIMLDKGLVNREEETRPHTYRAALPRRRVQKQLMRSLIDGAFSGSASSLILHALESNRLTDQELTHIRALLDEREQR